MFYSVGGRCLVDFSDFDLPIRSSEAIRLLENKGFECADVDLVEEARARVSKSVFRLGARMSEAPDVCDCSSFTKWLFGRKGMWIPRLAVQQFEYGTEISVHELRPGDLVFTSGYCLQAWHIGHVGLYCGSTVITAMIRKQGNGVHELPLDDLLTERTLRGFRRMVDLSSGAVTLRIPEELEIGSSDDIRYLVLSLLS